MTPSPIDTWTDGPTAAQQREAVERLQEMDAMALPMEEDMVRAREVAQNLCPRQPMAEDYLTAYIARVIAAERARVLEACAQFVCIHLWRSPHLATEIAKEILTLGSTPPGGPKDG